MFAIFTLSPPKYILIGGLVKGVQVNGAQAGLAQMNGKYQYLKDILGTVTDVLDVNGNVVQRYDYSAFGKIRSIKDASGNDITASPVVNTSFTFTGRELDSETGLYYYRARYYDANIGRFLQQDPDAGKLVNPATVVNKYVYVANMPTFLTDPTGKFLHILIGALIGAAVGAVIGAIDATENGGNFLEKVLKGAIGGALFGAAIAISPSAGLFALGMSVANAASRRENFFEVFNRNIISDGATALLLASANQYLTEWATSSNFVESLIPNTLSGLLKAGGLYIGLPYSIDKLLYSSCDDKNGSWSRSDICSGYNEVRSW